jgi:archaellum biogenesis protein FlaJ (TadC family)
MSNEEEELKALRDAWSTSVNAFDNTVIVISSGAFAIAFGFSDKIVKIETACYNWVYLISLCCFALPVIMGLSNFLRETYAADQAINLYVNYPDHPEDYEKHKDRSNKKSKWIRTSQMISLITGSLLLFLYIILNTSFL